MIILIFEVCYAHAEFKVPVEYGERENGRNRGKHCEDRETGFNSGDLIIYLILFGALDKISLMA